MGLFDQINTASNFNEDATREKHLPTIKAVKAGEKSYKVSIDAGGEGKHPNELEHWIQWVELRINGLFVTRAEFSASISEPVVDFVINVDKAVTISALSRCNKHGLWESSISIG